MSLSQVLEKRGDAASAVPLLRSALENLRKGSASRANFPEYLSLLGHALLATKAWAEAEVALREGLAIAEETFPGMMLTDKIRSFLGGASARAGKLAEAGPFLRSGYEKLAANPGAIPSYHKSCLTEALDRLIAFGEATGKADEVKAWKVERAKLAAPPRDAKKP